MQAISFRLLCGLARGAKRRHIAAATESRGPGLRAPGFFDEGSP